MTSPRAFLQRSIGRASCSLAQGKSVSPSVVDPSGQVATSQPKVATLPDQAMRRSSLRLLRLREASGLTQEDLGKRIGVTKRTIGSIERAEVRAVALQAFLVLLDDVFEKKGLDAVLAAILTSKLAEGRPSDQHVAEPLILGDSSVQPSARGCGAMAKDSADKPARVGGVGSPLVRHTDGLISGRTELSVKERSDERPDRNHGRVGEATIVKHTPKSNNGQGLSGTLRHAACVKPVLNPTDGGSPSCSANSTPTRKAAA